MRGYAVGASVKPQRSISCRFLTRTMQSWYA
jgi:hypothetical protein